MSRLILIPVGILTVIATATAVWFLNTGGKESSAVDMEIARLVKDYDQAIYINRDRKAARAVAQSMVDLADQSSNPTGTRVRGSIRLPYANIVMGKWDGTWRNTMEKCEALISQEPSVERAEFLLYSGHLIGRWGRHEFEAGLKRTEEGRGIANHIKDDRALALGYVFSTELETFLSRPVIMKAYRGMSVANSYQEKSIKVLALRNLLATLVYLDKIPEAAQVGERLLEIMPNSTAPYYPMFVNRLSTKLKEHTQSLLKEFNNTPKGTPGRSGLRVRLGLALTALGKAYFERKEFSKCCEVLEQAIPHLKSTNNTATLNSCLAFLQVAKLEFAKDVKSVDQIAEKTVEPTPLFADAIAKAYARFGEREKSLDWREEAVSIRSNSNSRDLSHFQASSDLIWESELNLRKKVEIIAKNKAESQSRIWLLSTALITGLTICALLSAFYFLLRRKSNSLEDLVNARTKSLQNAMQNANAADLAKSDFLAQINHEIRNPLTAILGYCQLLALKKDNSDELVEGIESSSLHLKGLVDNILEVSKIESNGLEAQPVEFNPKQTTSDVRGIMAEQAAMKGLDFECTFKGDSSCLISSDETKIRQIAINLISNAIKFTDDGSVTVSFDLKESNDPSRAKLVINVDDTGIGISESQSASVFERFSKASNAGNRDGSGLGLFITKRLAECMGGKITIQSTLGAGTQMTVTLPVEIISVSQEKPRSTTTDVIPFAEKPSVASRVLVVDDQQMIRNTLGLQLESYGLECKTVWGLERTIELVENWCPDLVLLDLRMPKHSGFEVLEEIRKSNNSSVAVFAMTGDATVQMQQKCLSVGFNGFITKPFNINSILKILEPKNQAI